MYFTRILNKILNMECSVLSEMHNQKKNFCNTGTFCALNMYKNCVCYTSYV